jgi:hypothetical protein
MYKVPPVEVRVKACVLAAAVLIAPTVSSKVDVNISSLFDRKVTTESEPVA